MRKIEFSELKLKNTYDENTFYESYLKTLQRELVQDKSFEIPEKKYEIFYLNILGGKIVLLNKDYLQKDDIDNQELYFDYKTAYEIYNYLLDIYDGIEDEKFEFNELYKNERLEKDSKINKLKLKDNDLFNQAVNKYNIIKSSQIYTEYLKLIKENKQLKETNNELIDKINNNTKNENIGFFQKIINKFRTKKLLDNGENK